MGTDFLKRMVDDNQTNTNEVTNNEVKVSSAKKPFLYERSIVRLLVDRDEVVLSGLGFAITSVCNIVDKLKKNETIIVKNISTGIMEGSPKLLPKIRVTVARGPKYAPPENKTDDATNEQ